ncbi:MULTISPECIES: FAD-dependent oxidoreductase [unclassified Ensifer]|uniref:NAD(P)/FAD-dependent oxidoreductase n=1 Tax=unclassified Ensifer TaxID=2633371 RepID=UPI0008138B76|nr:MULTISPECIES: FAD-dependent oxidoreductase [unclassified Ensifer]OCP09133.1 D-amino-acid oxidase [Ensifer sp. LC13]OCP10322.1 D-amino-acid oxidase [Ensifer sp. LC11]OCP14078.1 D-amino-acid oxidase [Ensifer sp. LC14]OCP32379.1 D-amino-acid oxidase [Ensifer sp. LC499]
MSELLVVGGGIMGLWAALVAARQGMAVRLVERQRIGAGASGGLLGALMPHMPDRWNAKKQFQFDALVSLDGEIGRLEAETGLSTGYRRTGRLMPLGKPHLRDIALGHEQDALTRWQAADRQFLWQVRNEAPEGWPSARAAVYGVVFDTLAARVSPRRMLATLRTALLQLPNVRLEEGAGVRAIDPTHGRAELDDASRVTFDHCIIAAGIGSFPLIDALSVPLKATSGTAVKGQAALLKADVDPDLPVIFTDGVYVIAHDDGHVAVGSTSENRFADPLSCDEQLDELLRRALVLAPRLADATVVERWAGLRPKSAGREPIVGRHPDHRNIFALTGGFKVSFGIAHRLAQVVVDEVAGLPTADIPESFLCQTHIAALREKHL